MSENVNVNESVINGVAIWLLLALLFIAQPLAAQNRAGGRAPARNPVTVRAELAALLLQSKRYEEAVREYQALVTREPGNNTYRLGLARALAWGKRPREAERELRILAARRPNDREIDTLLRSVRESFEPTAEEAESWLAGRPGYAPYRLALARALVREGRPQEALPHYETLIAQDNSPSLRREAVDAQFSAGEYDRAASLLLATLQRAPADSAARHTLARVLAATQRHDQALSHYDTLIAVHPQAALLLERAQLNQARRAFAEAEADATASIHARQNAEAYLLLAWLQRRRGELAQARASLERAALLNPDPRAWDEARAQQEREERPAIAFLPAWDEGTGLSARSALVRDNLGLLYNTVTARVSNALRGSTTGSAELELRRMSEPAAGVTDGLMGLALNAGIAQEVAYGPVLLRAGVRGGFAQQAEDVLPTFVLAATGWFRAWSASLEHTRAPAYPTLLSAATIQSEEPGSDVLSERSTSIALAGPLGQADLAIVAQRTDISDNNRRNSLHGVLRMPVAPNLTALAALTSISFDQSSSLYWDPARYQSIAGGLEYALHQFRGLSFALRALAGPARSLERFEDELDELIERASTALQVSGGIELSHRSDAGEFGAAVAYGSGRAGDYRRLEATVFLRRQR